jgi:hypothetical protein
MLILALQLRTDSEGLRDSAKVTVLNVPPMVSPTWKLSLTSPEARRAHPSRGEFTSPLLNQVGFTHFLSSAHSVSKAPKDP